MHYYEQAGAATAEAVERRIVSQLENRREYPKRVRESDRVPGAREAAINRLPYIAIIRVFEDDIQILNIAHTARKFPAF